MAITQDQLEIFVERIRRISTMQQGVRDESASLFELWNAVAMSSDPLFTGMSRPDGITPAQVTDMITVAQAVEAFWENQAVATADRQINLNRILAAINP